MDIVIEKEKVDDEVAITEDQLNVLLEEEDERTGMTVALTLGRDAINAMTYRSYVDPQEARPDLAYYGDKGAREKRTRAAATEMANPNFKMASSRVLLGSTFTQSYDQKEDTGLLEADLAAEKEPEKVKTAKKFGTWDGVFVSCLLNIFGVIMFLRLGWVVGQAGLPLAIVIILISSLVTVLTTLSMSAICTNGEIKAGGAYYLISRALGPKIGGAVGFLFSIGLTVAIAMYIIGFCETLVEQLPFQLTNSKLNDVRVWGMIILLIIFIMAMIGTDWVIKLQIGMFILLLGAIICFIIGAFTMTPTPFEGLVGMGSGAMAENSGPIWETQEGKKYEFFQVFGVFFPAVTGIMAGANISGDLANPGEAIPRGTLWAIGFSTIVYSGMAALCAAVVTKQTDDQQYGLLWDSLIMEKVSVWGPIVSAGIYVATFSSALASIVGGPRILQMLASDGIIPFLDPFKEVRARDGAPVKGYWAALVLGACCVAIGELNTIAPLITMFFMITYGLINFSCMALSLSKSPGWRPGFKYYTWWGACLGGILCFGIMVLTDWLYTLISFIIAAAIYKYIDHKDVPVNWGSAAEGQKDVVAVKVLMGLKTSQDHIKTFRPHYLVFSGDTKEREWMSTFVGTLKYGFGAVVYGNVIVDELHRHIFGGDDGSAQSLANSTSEKEKEAKDKTKLIKTGYVTGLQCDGFKETVVHTDFRAGCQCLAQLTGLGRLRPNTAILGFKEDWKDVSVEQYVGVIRDIMVLRMGLLIPRYFKPTKGNNGIDWETPSKGRVDVWWLADDGGLTVLITHIMKQHKFWKNSKVRLVMVVEAKHAISDLYKLVVEMMSNFRMKWEVHVCTVEKSKPSDFILSRYEEGCETPIEEQPRSVVTKRWLRTADLIKEESSDATLIVSIMPFPRGFDLSKDYMALLDCLSCAGRPIVFVRGSGENVLTFASE